MQLFVLTHWHSLTPRLTLRCERSYNRTHVKERSIAEELAGKRLAIVVTDDFEQVELEQPKKALEEAGASWFICSFGQTDRRNRHGPLTLIEADAVKGRRMTSYPSIKTDLRNAGAEWIDREVVTDRGFVTSRMPDDIPAFNRKMIEEFAEGIHQRQ